MSDVEERTGWAELGLGGVVELAKPGFRLVAHILDIIVFLIPSLIAWMLFGSYSLLDAFDTSPTFLSLGIVLIIGVAYDVALIAVWGQTLGKRVVGIKVVNAMTGEVPGWNKALTRWAVPVLPAAIPFVQYVGVIFTVLCYLSLGSDRIYQGWHDKAAGTLVIKT